jgi:hypothetical protein
MKISGCLKAEVFFKREEPIFLVNGQMTVGVALNEISSIVDERSFEKRPSKVANKIDLTIEQFQK